MIWEPKPGVRTVVEEEEITRMTNGVVEALSEYDDCLADLKDATIVTVTGGFLYDELSDDPYDTVRSLETEIRRWLKRQTYRTVLAEAPSQRFDDLKAAVRQLGGKLVG